MPIPALSNSQLQVSHDRQPWVRQARNTRENPTPSSLGLRGNRGGKNGKLVGEIKAELY